jgi:glycosyltransferase involved in cell wall biosynthesis
MNMLINAFSARLGGGQTYLSSLLDNTPERDDLCIYILCDDSLRLPPGRGNIRRIKPCWPTRNPLGRTIWEYLMLPRLLRELDSDVLFCPGGIVNGRLPPKCKIVTVFQNMLPFQPALHSRYPLGWARLRLWILAKILLGSIQRADHTIFISEHGRQIIEGLTTTPLKSTSVIYHGLSERFKAGDREGMDPPVVAAGTEYLAYVSIFDYYKNQVEVVRAFDLVKRSRPTREKLLLVGPDHSPYSALVRREIRDLGLDGDVVVTGSVPYEDLPGLYAHAKLNIFASDCENCPNVMLEAMGSGRPLLASAKPPMPEFGGDAVLYFNPANPEDIAAKILEVIDDPQRQRQLGALAAERAENFSWRETTRQTWAVIEALHRR